MIKVDGVQYTSDQVKDLIRERAELRDKVKELLGPFTCGHNPEYAGGACAACHAIWIDAAERAEKMADVERQRFAALLKEAMKRLCPHVDKEKCEDKACPGWALGKWSIIELTPSNFVGKPSTHCPACSGSCEFGLSDGEVPCLSCCGSGERSRKGPFYPKKHS